MLRVTESLPSQRRLALWMSVIALALGVGGSVHFYQVLAGMPAASWLTGGGFVLTGYALYLRSGISPQSSLLLHRGLAAAILGLGLMGFVQHMLTASLDRTLGEVWYYIEGRSLPVALPLLLAGAGLLLGSAGCSRAAAYCAVAVAGLMGIPLISLLYQAPAADAGGAMMLTVTAVLFLLVAFGILLADPDQRISKLWNSESPGRQLVRRLPQSVLVLALLGLASEKGAQLGLYEPHAVAPLLIVLTITWLALLFWRAATLLNREHLGRRKGETALTETNALLRAVSDNIPDAIFVKDKNGRMIFANPATLRILGKSAPEVIGHGSGVIYDDPDDAQAVHDHDLLVMASGKAFTFEETLHTPDGPRTFQSTRAPWRNEHGELLGLVGINTDITERKQLDDALRAHETQLGKLVIERTAEVRELIAHLESTREEEKRALARELHDDLGSALTALSMHLAILFRQMPDDSFLAERAQQIKVLLNSVTQTTRRIQAGLRPDKLDVFGIKAAIEDLAVEFENYTGVKCSVSLPDEELAYTPQAEIALFRMVQEALNNIAKHANASHASVVLDDNDECVMLSIRDDGVGFNAESDAAATHGLRGMRERAGYLGGDVVVRTASGQGTTVTIRIPKTAADEATSGTAQEGTSLRHA